MKNDETPAVFFLCALPTLWVPAQKYIRSSLAFHFQAEEVQNKIGESFYYGKPGFILSKEYAALWFRGAASEKYAPAQYNMALCHYFGEGIKQNNDFVLYWYKKAADYRSPLARNNLGYCYEVGIGTIPDPKMAERYYMLAAMQGNAHAQFNLAAFYAEENRFNESLEWLTKANSQGYIPAEEAIEAMAKGDRTTYIPKGLRYGLEKSPLIPNINLIKD